MVVEKSGVKLAITLVVIYFQSCMVGAQTSNCAAAITSLSPCMSFSIGNSSAPSSACCSQLASLVETTPMCLCDVMNGGGAELLGLVLNRTLTQALSGACNVHTPPLTDCNDDTGFGSQTPDSGDVAYSEGAKMKIPLLLAIFFLFHCIVYVV